jgi:hypothetical protein
MQHAHTMTYVPYTMLTQVASTEGSATACAGHLHTESLHQ